MTVRVELTPERLTVDLDALREWLDDAEGLEVSFPEGLTEHGERLMASLGVKAVT